MTWFMSTKFIGDTTETARPVRNYNSNPPRRRNLEVRNLEEAKNVLLNNTAINEQFSEMIAYNPENFEMFVNAVYTALSNQHAADSVTPDDLVKGLQAFANSAAWKIAMDQAGDVSTMAPADRRQYLTSSYNTVSADDIQNHITQLVLDESIDTISSQVLLGMEIMSNSIFAKEMTELLKQIPEHLLANGPLASVSGTLENINNLVEQIYIAGRARKSELVSQLIVDLNAQIAKFRESMKFVLRSEAWKNIPAEFNVTKDNIEVLMIRAFGDMVKRWRATGRADGNTQGRQPVDNALEQIANDINQKMKEDPGFLEKMPDDVKEIFRTIIQPLALAYELKTNPQAQVYLQNMLAGAIVAPRLTAADRDVNALIDKISKYSTVIADLIREKNIQENKEAKLAEARRELHALNISRPLLNIIAGFLGLKAEDLDPAVLRRMVTEIQYGNTAAYPA